MRPECWTSQGSLSCSRWQSVCDDWTATDVTHNCMPGCESILAVTGSWLISVCGFCLCGVRSWKFSCLVVFKDEGTFGPTAEELCRESRTHPLTWKVMWIYPSRQCFLWDYVTEHIYIWPFGILLLERHTEIERVSRPAVSEYFTQHKVLNPFQWFRITNQSQLQGTICPRRTVFISDSTHIHDVC
jgi:hypothetical protein